jgi:cytochrome P450 monooxygenase
MFEMSYLELLLLLTALTISSFFIGVARTREKSIRKHGCKEVPSLTGGICLWGIDLYYLFFNKSKSGNEKLPLGKQFELLGSTFRTQMSIKPLILTIDPRNVQAVFSSDASSYGNRPLRHFAFSPLVGNGVMTLDGSPHERARSLIRPTFSKAHIENEAAYDRHVQKLINSLAGDGSTLDLQPFFERLDLDSSTEFIFGESVASLDDAPDSLRASHKFPAAFNVAQQGMGARFRMLPFNFLHRDEKFWGACRTIREFVAESVQSALTRRKKNDNKIAMDYVLVDNVLQESQSLTEIQDTLMNVFLPGKSSRNLNHISANLTF